MPPLGPQHECHLLTGPVALAAQGLLALLAVGSLLLKRSYEKPQRPLSVWSLDVGKQGLGMLAAHASGVAAAILIAHTPNGHASSECSWYFFAFLADTTLGMALSLGLHMLIMRVASGEAGQGAVDTKTTLLGALKVLVPCGDYGTPPRWERWAAQALEWVMCVVGARAACGSIIFACAPLLQRLAARLDAAFAGRPSLELAAVMIVCPLAVNIAQVLVQDAVLRWRAQPSGAVPEPSPPPGSGRSSQGSEIQMLMVAPSPWDEGGRP
ncbi:hypothetical protein ACKKBG_A30515 [Auxenochlorella protothecoides x Auxenochlorella symbiontica]